MPDNVIALASFADRISVLASNLDKDKSKDLLEDLEHTPNACLERKVL